MTTAREIIDSIRDDLAPLVDRVRNHPYVAAIERGEIAREKLRIFAGEQYYILRYDTRSFAALLARQDDRELRRFFLANPSYEATAYEAIFDFAAALGMSEADLNAYEPLPGAHAYTAFLALTAYYGSGAEMAGAFVIDMEGWGGNCRVMSRSLRDRYGLGNEAVRFFDHFAADDPTFESRSLAVIDHVLQTAPDPEGVARDVRRTARLMLSYELLYWDTLFEASGG